MKIKICGVTRACDIEFINLAQPDYVGFVFAESRLKISSQTASDFKRMLLPEVKTVGVFVDGDTDFINNLLADGIIDIAQLHGRESDDDISRINGTVIKAVRIGERINRPCEYLLFDSEKGASGKTFDWSLLPQTDKPFFLAGGINACNIGDAMKYNPYCIDVSSGVETDGYKDKKKIIEIIRRVRNG